MVLFYPQFDRIVIVHFSTVPIFLNVTVHFYFYGTLLHSLQQLPSSLRPFLELYEYSFVITPHFGNVPFHFPTLEVSLELYYYIFHSWALLLKIHGIVLLHFSTRPIFVKCNRTLSLLWYSFTPNLMELY